jgi:hypothetical protein
MEIGAVRSQRSYKEFDMSMELWVFSDKQLSSIAEWQAAIDAQKNQLRLSDVTPFEKLNGFLPSHLGDELKGFECYHDDAGELIRNNSDLNFGHTWKYALAFRWLGSKENETLAAWMAGAAYARATDGIVFNDQDSRFRTASETLDVVRNIEHPSQTYEEVKRELRRRRGLAP